MATTTWNVNKDTRVALNGSNYGAGASDYLPVGLYSGYKYRAYLGFSYSFSGMVSITSAILHVKTSSQSYVGFGSDPDVQARRITTSSWSEGSSVGLSTSNATVYGDVVSVDDGDPSADISTSENTWETITVTNIVQAAFAAGTFRGIELRAVDETTATDVTEFYAREYGSNDAYITVTYTTNVGPNAPTSLSPTGGGIVAGGLTPTIAFTHSDNDGDALLDYDLQVSTDATFASVTHWNVAAQTTGITGNNVSRVYAGTALTRGTTYYWRARTSSAAGVLTEGPWTAAQSFKVNQLPTVTYVTPSAADALVEMVKVPGAGVNPRMVVRWTFADPDGGSQYSYRVVTVTDALAAFDDSGTIVSTVNAYTIPVDATRAAFYRVTITVTDANGESVSTAQRRMKAQWAVAEYRVDLGATVTAWSAAPSSTGGTNKGITVEYASSAAGGAITTWYSTLGGAPLARWFHWRVFLFAWSGATTPQMDKMTLTYTNSAAVPPDGWTVSAQWALDTATRVYGTQSLKGTCNTTALYAYQLVPVEPNTDYILSGRIKSDGNSVASISIAASGAGTSLATSPTIGATQEFGRVATPVWNSGSNSSVYVRCRIAGAAGTFAWFDALKMEASTVVTPWTPGFVGKGIAIDAGGLQIDASPAGGAVLRLQGSSGGARDTVALGTNGLVFGGDVKLYSPSAGMLRIDNTTGSADQALQVGDDATFYDVDVADAIGIKGQSNAANGEIIFGSGKDTNIKRFGANLLGTDDTFYAGGTIRTVGGFEQIGGRWHGTTAISAVGALDLNTADSDPAGFLDAANDRLVVPAGKAGLYFFSVTVNVAGATGNYRWSLNTPDGNIGAVGNHTTANAFNQTWAGLVDLAVGGTVQITNVSANPSACLITRLSMIRVGASGYFA
jgi:hypothetical protein